MRIRKSEWFNFENAFEEPEVQNLPEPYQIERLETPAEVIWFGHNTNWKKDLRGHWGWEKLIMGDFYPCEEPIYEKIYQDLYGNN